MDNHWEEWRLLEEGEAKGEARGKAEAEAAYSEEQKRLEKLISILKGAQKIELALEAVTDPALRKRLYEQYDIH